MNITVHKIYDLYDILRIADDFKNGHLLIDIDMTCAIEECLLAELYDNNPVIRDRIIKRTRQISFSKTSDKLLPTHFGFADFVNISREIFKNISFVTKRKMIEFDKIRNDLSDKNVPIDIDIIEYDKLKNTDINADIIFYIDVNDNAIKSLLNKKNRLVLLNMYPF